MQHEIPRSDWSVFCASLQMHHATPSPHIRCHAGQAVSTANPQNRRGSLACRKNTEQSSGQLFRLWPRRDVGSNPHVISWRNFTMRLIPDVCHARPQNNLESTRIFGMKIGKKNRVIYPQMLISTLRISFGFHMQ
jgi:hypothetical protein